MPDEEPARWRTEEVWPIGAYLEITGKASLTSEVAAYGRIGEAFLAA